MLERAALVIGFALLVLIVALALRAISRNRAAAVQGEMLPAELRERLPEQGPGIVYFYGPHCATCRQQGAIVDRLSSDKGVAVVRVDAVEDMALAQALGVMTVPTTVIVDARRNIRAVNPGLRSEHALAAQLLDLAASHA